MTTPELPCACPELLSAASRQTATVLIRCCRTPKVGANGFALGWVRAWGTGHGAWRVGRGFGGWELEARSSASGFGEPPKPTGQRPGLPMAITRQSQADAFHCRRHGHSLRLCSRFEFRSFDPSNLFRISDLALRIWPLRPRHCPPTARRQERPDPQRRDPFASFAPFALSSLDKSRGWRFRRAAETDRPAAGALPEPGGRAGLCARSVFRTGRLGRGLG